MSLLPPELKNTLQLPVPPERVIVQFVSAPVILTVPVGDVDPPVTVTVTVTGLLAPASDGSGVSVVMVVTVGATAGVGVGTVIVTPVMIVRALEALIVLMANGISFGMIGVNSFETVTDIRWLLSVGANLLSVSMPAAQKVDPGLLVLYDVVPGPVSLSIVISLSLKLLM